MRERWKEIVREFETEIEKDIKRDTKNKTEIEIARERETDCQETGTS